MLQRRRRVPASSLGFFMPRPEDNSQCLARFGPHAVEKGKVRHGLARFQPVAFPEPQLRVRGRERTPSGSIGVISQELPDIGILARIQHNFTFAGFACSVVCS